MVLWDKIVMNGEKMELDMKSAKVNTFKTNSAYELWVYPTTSFESFEVLTVSSPQTKYYFRNFGKGLLGHENITLILNWNVMPNMGDLKWLKSAKTYSFKLPTEYYSTMKRGH